MQVTLVLMHIL